jgi:hypothetical protein
LGELSKQSLTISKSFTETGYRLMPVYATSVGKWRHYVERLAPLRVRLATQIPLSELA